MTSTITPNRKPSRIIPDASISNFFRPSPSYKPFLRPWCFDMWETHEEMHWLKKEIRLQDDVKEFRSNMTEGEVNLITHILKYFTQQDVEVSEGYSMYLNHIWLGEARQMMIGFQAREQIHKDAYAYFTDTIGLPEGVYSEFLHIDEMRKMHDYLKNVEVGDVYTLLLSIAVFAGFAEGMTLFGSFVMLLAFSRNIHGVQKGRMIGMSQIVSYSVKDETVHVEGMSRLFRELLEDVKHLIDMDRFKSDLRRICEEMVALELNFIDVAYGLGEAPSLPRADLHRYIRYIADVRMGQLGQEPVYNESKNPLPWVDEMVHAVEHTNFFENRAIEYTRGGSTGTWEEAFAYHDRTR